MQPVLMRFRPRNVRTRLALWYALVAGVVLFTYICGAGVLQFVQLRSQIYHDEIQDVETAEGLLFFTPDGEVQMRESYHNHPQSRLLIDRLMEVFDKDGKVLFRNDRLGKRDLGGKPFPGEGETSYNERDVKLADGVRVILISHVHAIDGRPLLIRLAYSVAPLEHRMLQFVALLVLALPATLVVAGFAASILARRALAPLEDMTLRTKQITATNLRDRLPMDNEDDELGRMAVVLNGLLERLHESFERLRQFNSDVSHELRTPLASIRSVGEVGLQQANTPAEYRDVIGSMLEEVSRLTQLVETLLTVSKADAGQLHLRPSVFSMLELVREASGLVEILAEEKQQSIQIRGDDNSYVEADPLFLRQAIVNILDNAVKYSPPGSTLQVTVSRCKETSDTRESVEVEVRDAGPGIPASEQAKVFDRFYRVGESRARAEGGAGLGLAIAKWAVEAHRGEIGVRQTLASGCHVFVRLPASPPPEVKGSDRSESHAVEAS